MVGFTEPQLPLEQGEAHAPPVQPPGVYVTVVPDEDCPAKEGALSASSASTLSIPARKAAAPACEAATASKWLACPHAQCCSH